MSAGPDARSLDHPVRSSLLGPHARFAQRHGGVLRYLPPVAPFAALPDQPGDRDWADAAALAGPGGLVALAGVTMPPPPGWKPVLNISCVQMIDAGIAAAPDDEAVRLGAPDVPPMPGLLARTEPGPFLPRTTEMGTYLGIRRGGALVAMAGERLHPPGWTEISAVCTHGAYRGRGLGTGLVLAVAAGIRARGSGTPGRLPASRAAAQSARTPSPAHGVQVRLGLLDQEEHQLRLVSKLQLEDHSGQEQQVGGPSPEVANSARSTS